MRVDLRSDTVTRPTPGMREAMARAEVGDDVFGDDPTVLALQERVATLLGKEAALFVPSGTMANQIAVALHTRPGDAVLAEARSHIAAWEAGAPAWISGATVLCVAGETGVLPTRAVDDAVARRGDPHAAPLTLVCAEDTANGAGGTVAPLDQLDALAVAAKAAGCATHLDGARLWNASVASGIAPARRARHFDTVSVCLSKGLGAPVGSLVCGPRDLVRRAVRVRKALGGGMRQAGILAAAGLHALDHHVDRLADDHARATRLATALMEMGWDAPPPASNLVYATVPPHGPDAATIVAMLRARGVGAGAVGARRVRFVTHLDVDDDGLQVCIDALAAGTPR